METDQKLEFLAGVATFLSSFLFIYVIDYPEFKRVAEFNKEPFNYDWTRTFLVLILPTLLIAIGSYFHAFKQSKIGFVTVIISAGFVFLFNLLGNATGVVIGMDFEGNFLVGISPGLFAFTTIAFAIYNKYVVEE
jgi:uncharacterized Tic20 family protein